MTQCLESLRNQSFQEMVTVVVDNGSRDGSQGIVRDRFPEVTLIELPENLGFAAANNIAIQIACTDYVALLNNDAVADSLWLESLMNAMISHPEAGFAASKMLYLDDPGIIDRAGDGYTTAGAGCLRGRGQTADAYQSVEWIFGACAGAAIYRMSMLKDIGCFDEDFFLLYEDVDLSFRAQLKGYRCLYVPNAQVCHKATSTIGYDSYTSVYYGHRNLEWVYFQNMPFHLLIRTLWRHILYIITAGGYFTATGHAVAYIRAKLDSILAWKTVWNKRRQIQTDRRVAVNYIQNLLESEQSLTRLTRRLKR